MLSNKAFISFFVVKNLINQTQTKQEKLQAIKKELQTDFGDVWEDLGQEAQKALITGIYIYSAMLEVGTEYYHDFDFAPVINQFSKAYEIQLKKYFYTGFLQYVKRKKISVYEFVNPNEVRQISIIETYYKNKKRTKVGYRYFDEQNGNGFDYAYRYPGMNKVLQAAGRVIRTEEDIGIVALLDERFLQSSYTRLFPREWSEFQIVQENNVGRYAEKFWNEWL